MQSARYPVVSPALKEREALREPQDLRRAILMHDETMDAWEEWFEAAGVNPPAFPRGPTFPNCELATTAAEMGQGVALAYDAVVRGTLVNGTLVRLFDKVTMPFVIYSVAYPITRKNDPMVREFSDWLHAQVRADGVSVQRDLVNSIAGTD